MNKSNILAILNAIQKNLYLKGTIDEISSINNFSSLLIHCIQSSDQKFLNI